MYSDINIIPPQTTPIETRQSERALILFTEHPAKAAFRKHYNDVKSCEKVHHAFLKHLFSVMQSAQENTDFDIIIATETENLPNIKKIVETQNNLHKYHFIAHDGCTFDQKFKHALTTTFSAGYQKVSIIGNDCLDLTSEILQKNFQQLENNDVVLGPAKDGGFYLFGLNQYAPEVFEGVTWCSSSVFSQIRKNIQTLNISAYLLSTLSDIDSPQELLNWLSLPKTVNQMLLYTAIVNVLFHSLLNDVYIPPFRFWSYLQKRFWQLPPPCLSL